MILANEVLVMASGVVVELAQLTSKQGTATALLLSHLRCSVDRNSLLFQTQTTTIVITTRLTRLEARNRTMLFFIFYNMNLVMALFFVGSRIFRQKLNFVAVEASSCKTLQYTDIVLYSQARDVKPPHANATRLHGNVTLLLNIYLATIEIPTLLSPSSPAKATKDGGIFLIPPSCNMVVFKLLSLESIFVTTPNLRQDIYIFARLIVRQQQISCGSIIRQASSVSPVYCCTVLVTESV